MLKYRGHTLQNIEIGRYQNWSFCPTTTYRNKNEVSYRDVMPCSKQSEDPALQPDFLTWKDLGAFSTLSVQASPFQTMSVGGKFEGRTTLSAS